MLGLSGVVASQLVSAQNFDLEKKQQQRASKTTLNYVKTVQSNKLDVIIPVFDPNISSKDIDGVWPEVRRAEANRFAFMMKLALEKSRMFGAVRVSPDDSAFGEIYVHGKIIKANGEDIELQIYVNDIRGSKKKILSKKFRYRVQENFHASSRTSGTDAYWPIFDKIATEISKKINRKKEKDLNKLSDITTMRFANMFGPEYFSKYTKEKRGNISLVSFPSNNDPVYRNVQTIRIQEQLFVDNLQPYYKVFANNMNSHYYEWQKYAYTIAKEKRKAKSKANAKLFTGILIAGLGVATGNADLAEAGITAGAILAYTSIRDFQNSNQSSQVLNEMGKTLNLDISAQVVEFEGVQTKLEGDAVDQFVGYRKHLMKIYALEATPDILIPSSDIIKLENNRLEETDRETGRDLKLVKSDEIELKRVIRANSGDAVAQYDLGVKLMNVQGNLEDNIEAVKWLQLSAGQGYGPAQHGLGFMYGNGAGVRRDFMLAHMWWSLAAANGNETAKKDILVVEKYMTKIQIIDAQNMTREWVKEKQQSKI